MLAALAEPGPASAVRREAFAAALDRARANVTETDEAPLLDQLDRLAPDALDGDAEARLDTVRALERLGAVNRASMAREDVTARQRGTAGAWAAVVLALVGALLSVAVVRRLRRRVLLPLLDLHDTLRDARAGNRFRRSSVRGAPPEIGQVADGVNELLEVRRAGEPSEELTRRAALDRAALLHLLDARGAPLLVVDDSGRIQAANRPALELLDGPDGDGLRREAAALADIAGVAGSPLRREARLGELGWLVSRWEDEAP